MYGCLVMPARSISSQPLPTFSPKRETGLRRERIHKAVGTFMFFENKVTPIVVASIGSDTC